jgi:nucleoside-diphosphate-sugar epimerase
MIGFGQKELMDRTAKGTKNVLEACSATNVQKLVVVSSVAASLFDPNSRMRVAGRTSSSARTLRLATPTSPCITSL